MSIVLDGTAGITSPSVNAGNIVGQVCFFGMTTAPDGFLKANGAAISRTTYADLFAAIGTTYGAGDGSTTFALPDLRGEFIRGWADGRAVDTGRAFGSAQSDGIRASHARMRPDSNGNAPWGGPADPFSGEFSGEASTASTTMTVNGTSRATFLLKLGTAPDTRPRNVALLACIKF